MKNRTKLLCVGLASLAVSGCLDLPAQLVVAGGVAAATAIVAAANSDGDSSNTEIVGYCWDPGQSTAYGSTSHSCTSPSFPISKDEYDGFKSSGAAPAAAHYQRASASVRLYCHDVAKDIAYSINATACLGTDKRITETEWRDLQEKRDAEIAAKQEPVYCWNPDLALPYEVSGGASCGTDRRITKDQYNTELAKKEAAEQAQAAQQAKVEKGPPTAAPAPAQKAPETPKTTPDTVTPAPVQPSPVQQAAYAPPELSLKDFEVTGSGTGFYVSGDGLILTNHHVVNGCETIAAISDYGTYEAKALDSNARFDLAVLRTPVASEKFASFAAVAPEQGDNVYAIGYPLLGDFREIKITDGIVSGLSGPDRDTSRIQMTAAVQPGNSGGPLLNQSGAVVGVVVSKYTGDIGGGFYAEGINFAVAHEAAAAFLSINGVTARRTTATKDMKNRDIMKRAEQWTIPLLCLTKGKAG